MSKPRQKTTLVNPTKNPSILEKLQAWASSTRKDISKKFEFFPSDKSTPSAAKSRGSVFDLSRPAWLPEIFADKKVARRGTHVVTAKEEKDKVPLWQRVKSAVKAPFVAVGNKLGDLKDAAVKPLIGAGSSIKSTILVFGGVLLVVIVALILLLKRAEKTLDAV